MGWTLLGWFVGFVAGWVACAMVAAGARCDAKLRIMLQMAADDAEKDNDSLSQ